MLYIIEEEFYNIEKNISYLFDTIRRFKNGRYKCENI